MTPIKIDPVRYCAAPNCTRVLVRKRYGGRMEDRAIFLRRRFCGLACSALAHRKEDASRSARLKRVAPLRKKKCERCGSTENLSTHHKDRDWQNDDPDNLETLCSKCHTSHHHEHEDILPRAREKDCPHCGRKHGADRRVCATCKTRKRKAAQLGLSLEAYVASLGGAP